MASRSVDELHPGTRKKWCGARDEWNGSHPNPVFEVCTYRSAEEQAALLLQGRSTLQRVNEARGRVGLPPITEAENRRQVTWTLASKHIERRAVDFAFKMPKPFDLKADIDGDGAADFAEFGAILQRHGLQWGIRNRKGQHIDLGHCQDNDTEREV